MKLLDRAKTLYKAFKERRGFTLPEVAAVVAIVGTLAAIVVPVSIDQIEKGRQARAAMDVNGISQGLSGFFRDTGEWPDRNGTDPDFYMVLRSGNIEADFDLFETNLDLLANNVRDPARGLTNWGATSGTVDAFVNHLTLDSAGYVDNDINWNGPYMPQVFNDPWGRNYLVYSYAFTEPDTIADGDPDTGEDVFVWVISGGQNKTLETNVTSPILNNNPVTDGSVSTVADDIGRMVFKAREGVLGVQS
ncbi:MAG: prepilin-type N-terminal cleavage/methylation domain-containing protein [Candidatus Bathyanammoxibius sp.]